MRHRLGDKRDQLLGDVDHAQNDGKYRVLAGAKRRRNQFMGPTADALDFDVVEQADRDFFPSISFKKG